MSETKVYSIKHKTLTIFEMKLYPPLTVEPHQPSVDLSEAHCEGVQVDLLRFDFRNSPVPDRYSSKRSREPTLLG